MKQLSIASLDACRAEAGVLFEEVSSSAFHPHALTISSARELTWTKDIHSIALLDHEAVVYGLLRGWDAGFSVPSLGIAVHPQYRSRGLGRMMMEYLHCCARLRGATSVRLKVYPDNIKARRLYESLGYVWSPDLEEDQLVGIAPV